LQCLGGQYSGILDSVGEMSLPGDGTAGPDADDIAQWGFYPSLYQLVTLSFKEGGTIKRRAS